MRATAARRGWWRRSWYRSPADLNDITLGNNNGFEAGPGWDPVTGLGSPKGDAIAATLSEASVRS